MTYQQLLRLINHFLDQLMLEEDEDLNERYRDFIAYLTEMLIKEQCLS